MVGRAGPITVGECRVAQQIGQQGGRGERQQVVVTGDHDGMGVGQHRGRVVDQAMREELVRRAGGRVISDESPSGGRHLYVSFRVPVGFHDARDLALADWRKALVYVTAQPAKKPTHHLVHNSPTSGLSSYGGPAITDQDQQRTRGTPGEYQWIRTWWNALDLVELTRYAGRAGISKRWLLRAMGKAAMKPGPGTSRSAPDPGPSTGLDHTTVAAHLRALREEADPLLDLIENDRGLAGDLYQLRIPDEITDKATTISWKAGKLHALRPVFRDLGHTAALVYEALEHTRGRPQRSFDLTGPSGLSRRAVYEALETRAAWNLIAKEGRWLIVAGTSLHLLAEQFGCVDTIRTQINCHRDERAQYRRAPENR
jgi:hypothetical protein